VKLLLDENLSHRALPGLQVATPVRARSFSKG
jgi:hypothetical protein